MPKKTKRQKILAGLHRKQQLSQLPTTQVIEKSSVVASLAPAPTFTFQTQTAIQTTHKNIESSTDYAVVSQDLKRITIFTVLALIFQGVLYFVLHKGI